MLTTIPHAMRMLLSVMLLLLFNMCYDPNAKHIFLRVWLAMYSPCLDLHNLCVLPTFAGHAEENSYADYGTSSCYYNCTVDSSMAPRCHNYANIVVQSSPSTTNQSMSTRNGLNYIISDLQRCQRYTVEVTAQVGAHKYTNQTQATVTLGEFFY